MSSNESLETLQLDSGLSLVARVKINLTVHRSDASVKQLDEWQLKRSLIDFLKASFSITVPEHDLHVRKFKEMKKRKREDPVARGTLFIRDLGFLSPCKIDREELEKKIVEWRKGVVDKVDGIELSLVGVRFKLSAEIPQSEDFEGMKKEWDQISAFGGAARGYSRGGKREPDTIVLRGVPSRWFAETRVSSKPSMLVTHTIFSALGKIRNLDVAEDMGKDEDDEDIVPGLHCKIVVRFEDHRELCKALKVLCLRSLQKQGSRLTADYEVTWDKDDLFRNNTTSQNGNYKREAARYQSRMPRFSENNTSSKRFQE